jgi:hypothetical protein
MEDMKISPVGHVILRKTFSEFDRHCPLFESLSYVGCCRGVATIESTLNFANISSSNCWTLRAVSVRQPRNLIPSEWPIAGHAHQLGDDKGGLSMTCAQSAMLRISQSRDRWFSDQGWIWPVGIDAERSAFGIMNKKRNEEHRQITK